MSADEGLVSWRRVAWLEVTGPVEVLSGHPRKGEKVGGDAGVHTGGRRTNLPTCMIGSFAWEMLGT